jgi:hypothetical protein
MLLANFQPSSTTPAPTDAGTSAPTDAGMSAPTGAGTPPTTVTSTTDGASRISENHFMFFASLFLVLFSFLEI